MSAEISSTDINRLIRHLVWARLRDVGFDRRTARTAWRRWSEGVDVVNFQSFNSYLAGGVGCTTFSFAVNLGTTLDYVPGSVTGEASRPKEWQCPLRLHLRKRLSQPIFRPYAGVRDLIGASAEDAVDRSDVWYVNADGSNIEENVADAAAVLESEGLPWFALARDPSALLGRLQAGDAGDDLGTPTSPNMALLVGFVARRAGMHDLARTNLMRARQFDGYRLIAEEIEAAIEQVV
jgi:hypothetical protein